MFLLSSLKTLTNSNACFESRIKILYQFSLALIGRVSQEYIHGRLKERFSGSWAAFGTTFRVTAGTSSLSGLMEVFLQLVSDFIEASSNLI
jgi:hypothetical protein